MRQGSGFVPGQSIIAGSPLSVPGRKSTAKNGCATKRALEPVGEVDVEVAFQNGTDGEEMGVYGTPCFLAKSAQTHEKREVAIFVGARKCKKVQKSAQEYENKGRMIRWQGARVRK